MSHKVLHKAFTLIELSIVLVVIGLVIGGILVGKDLIRHAQLTKMVTQAERYRTLVMIFKDRYAQLPGDFSGASQMWGNYTYNSGTDAAAGSQNGNNNGVIGDKTCCTGVAQNERYEFWRQLGLSSILKETAKGRTGNATVDVITPGQNIPALIDDTAYVVSAYTPYGGGGANFYKNFITIGKARADGVEIYPLDSIATNPEAKMLDIKFDDGKAGLGRITAIATWSSTTNDSCAGEYYSCGGDCSALANYDSPKSQVVNNKTKLECNLMIQMD